jgi:hypothetical protein
MALSFTGSFVTSISGSNGISGISGINGVTNTTVSRCRKYKGFYPSFTPDISNLSTHTSVAGEYSLVSISGQNFLPNGTTYVNFVNSGSGRSYTNIQVIYNSSFNISFVVPAGAPVGLYDVVVVNVYNNNFSPSVNQSYPGTLNYSNALEYRLSHFNLVN